MKNILVSMCLCNVPCRYDGKNVPFEEITALTDRFNVIAICPEIMGGLSTPRLPSQLLGDKVMSENGEDVTEAFEKGAKRVLKLAKDFDCRVAILKEYSPSCGVNFIYDGTFSGNKIYGQGLTTRLLKENGIEVYSDLEVDDFLNKYL